MSQPSSALHLGAHLSISKGLATVFDQAREYGCDALQLFTKNARAWKERHISAQEAEEFARTWQNSSVTDIAAHCGYLINLATPDADLFEKSQTALENELHRAGVLGIPYLVMHPGSHRGAGPEKGFERIKQGLDRLFDTGDAPGTLLLLEITAGRKNELGSCFEDLARIIEDSRYPDRLGICFDTCHAHGAGYDLGSPEACRQVIRKLDDILGLERLKVIHMNDSTAARGSRVDRHAHIGQGEIGLECFRFFMQAPDLAHIPKILETPKIEGKKDMDPVNLQLLRRLAAGQF